MTGMGRLVISHLLLLRPYFNFTVGLPPFRYFFHGLSNNGVKMAKDCFILGFWSQSQKLSQYQFPFRGNTMSALACHKFKSSCGARTLYRQALRVKRSIAFRGVHRRIWIKIWFKNHLEAANTNNAMCSWSIDILAMAYIVLQEPYTISLFYALRCE